MSAAVEHIRAVLADGIAVEGVRLDEPHRSALVAAGLLPVEYIGELEPGDMSGRMVVRTADGEYQTVLPSL
jgi:hypothetical protein